MVVNAWGVVTVSNFLSTFEDEIWLLVYQLRTAVGKELKESAIYIKDISNIVSELGSTDNWAVVEFNFFHNETNRNKIGLLLCHSHIELRLWLRLS